jgi:hypothetical protein
VCQSLGLLLTDLSSRHALGLEESVRILGIFFIIVVAKEVIIIIIIVIVLLCLNYIIVSS